MNLFGIGTLTLLTASTVQAVWIAGVNIAGCDIGMDNNGNYEPQNSWTGQQMCPTPSQAQLQMQHFNSKDQFVAFRLPVPWQSLVNNDLVTNNLDENFMSDYYDPMVRACLATGAHCVIDIHNYARWWNETIGQGGPNDNILATTWSQLATRYNSPNVIFGIMNEPHDLDIKIWANTLQTSVTAIRKAIGNNNNIILLAGSDFTSAGSFAANSEPALSIISNLDGSKTNLIYEVHQYFDFDQSGTHESCSIDASGTFSDLAAYIRGKGRQVFVGEIGGGNNQGCVDLINKSLDVLNSNGDVYIGWTSWSAGAFPSSYELYEGPNPDGSDQLIVAKAFAPKYIGSKN